MSCGGSRLGDPCGLARLQAQTRIGSCASIPVHEQPPTNSETGHSWDSCARLPLPAASVKAFLAHSFQVAPNFEPLDYV